MEILIIVGLFILCFLGILVFIDALDDRDFGGVIMGIIMIVLSVFFTDKYLSNKMEPENLIVTTPHQVECDTIIHCVGSDCDTSYMYIYTDYDYEFEELKK